MTATTFEEARESILAAFEALAAANETQAKALALVMHDNGKLWGEVGALRDELHEAQTALGNRIESVSRMVNTVRS